jgi:hypothetical protein
VEPVYVLHYDRHLAEEQSRDLVETKVQSLSAPSRQSAPVTEEESPDQSERQRSVCFSNKT